MVLSDRAPLATPQQLQYINIPLHPSLCPYSSARVEIRTLILAIIHWYLSILPTQFGELTVYVPKVGFNLGLGSEAYVFYPSLFQLDPGQIEEH